jgi:hypothetical protein
VYHNAIALSVCKRSFICIYLSNRSCYSSPGRLVNIRMFVAFKAFALAANKENLSSDLPCTHVFTIFLPMSLHSSITCTVYGLIVPIYKQFYSQKERLSFSGFCVFSFSEICCVFLWDTYLKPRRSTFPNFSIVSVLSLNKMYNSAH